MNGFLPNDFNRTGRAGILTVIGNGNELGASRAISLAHNHRDRNSDSKGNSNINRGLRFSNISNRDNNRFSHQDHSTKENLRFSGQDHNLRREASGNRDKSRDLRLSNYENNLKKKFSGSRDNLRREFSGSRDKSRDLRLSAHNTLSLKENLKEGRENTKSRMTISSKKVALYDSYRLARPRRARAGRCVTAFSNPSIPPRNRSVRAEFWHRARFLDRVANERGGAVDGVHELAVRQREKEAQNRPEMDRQQHAHGRGFTQGQQ